MSRRRRAASNVAHTLECVTAYGDARAALLEHCRIGTTTRMTAMSQQLITDTSEAFADSDAITTVSAAAVIVIDDNWLEAVLDNLALAKLSRREGIDLIARLEAFEVELERSSPRRPHLTARVLQIVVGDHFDANVNEHAMRAPDAMSADNVLETIEHAARHFVTDGHAAALKQLVFFISGNLEEVIDEDDELGED